MGLYLVIDPEEKTKAEILAALEQIDNQAQIIYKTSIAQWRKDRAEKQETKLEFDLIVLNFEEFEITNWPDELKQVRTEISLGKDPNIILVGYESPNLSRKLLTRLDFFNFVFKPFDKLILKETVHTAMSKKKRITPLEIKAQKSAAFIAVLKEIELQSVSELGFVTLSDELIPAGATSKYFSNLFQHEKKVSTWAQCLKSVPHPGKPNTFINQFQLFGIESGALMALRRHIQSHKSNVASSALWYLGKPAKSRTVTMALVAPDGTQSRKLKADLENYFQNFECDLLDPQKSPLEKKHPQYDFVLNWSDVGPEALKKEFGEQTKFFWLLEGFAIEDDRTKVVGKYADCFILPIDKSYMFKKLKIHVADLEPKEEIELLNIFSHEKMKSANLIQISEINEIFLTFNYHRELTYKTFREFTLFSDDERNMIELPAFCAFAEKNGNEKGKFIHQFLFFATTDHYLKAIRVWLLQDYISQKQKNN